MIDKDACSLQKTTPIEDSGRATLPQRPRCHLGSRHEGWFAVQRHVPQFRAGGMGDPDFVAAVACHPAAHHFDVRGTADGEAGSAVVEAGDVFESHALTHVLGIDAVEPEISQRHVHDPHVVDLIQRQAGLIGRIGERLC